MLIRLQSKWNKWTLLGWMGNEFKVVITESSGGSLTIRAKFFILIQSVIARMEREVFFTTLRLQNRWDAFYEWRALFHFMFLITFMLLQQDFGTLSCWAINEIGEQSVSCLFQVVLAGEFYKVSKSAAGQCESHCKINFLLSRSIARHQLHCW